MKTKIQYNIREFKRREKLRREVRREQVKTCLDCLEIDYNLKTEGF